jgi:sec-independent protein translocase protein TatB
LFDIAFSELVVIGVVALVVIGPEKLPQVARTLGSLVGRMQRYIGSVRTDIEREMQFEDLQKLQQEIKQGVDNARMVANEHAAEMAVENSIGAVLPSKPAEPKDPLP